MRRNLYKENASQISRDFPMMNLIKNKDQGVFAPV